MDNEIEDALEGCHPSPCGDDECEICYEDFVDEGPWEDSTTRRVDE